MGFKEFFDDKINGSKNKQEQAIDEPGRNQRQLEDGLAADLEKQEQTRMGISQEQVRARAAQEKTQGEAREYAEILEAQRPIERLATRVEATQTRDAAEQRRDEKRTLAQMIADGRTPIPAREDFEKQYPQLQRPTDREHER